MSVALPVIRGNGRHVKSVCIHACVCQLSLSMAQYIQITFARLVLIDDYPSKSSCTYLYCILLGLLHLNHFVLVLASRWTSSTFRAVWCLRSCRPPFQGESPLLPSVPLLSWQPLPTSIRAPAMGHTRRRKNREMEMTRSEFCVVTFSERYYIEWYW